MKSDSTLNPGYKRWLGVGRSSPAMRHLHKRHVVKFQHISTSITHSPQVTAATWEVIPIQKYALTQRYFNQPTFMNLPCAYNQENNHPYLIRWRRDSQHFGVESTLINTISQNKQPQTFNIYIYTYQWFFF